MSYKFRVTSYIAHRASVLPAETPELLESGYLQEYMLSSEVHKHTTHKVLYQLQILPHHIAASENSYLSLDDATYYSGN